MSTNPLHRIASGVAHNVRPRLHRDRKHNEDSQDYAESPLQYPVEPSGAAADLPGRVSDLNRDFQVPPSRPPRPDSALLPPSMSSTVEYSHSMPMGQMGIPANTWSNAEGATVSQTAPYPETGTGPYRNYDPSTHMEAFSSSQMGFYAEPCFPENTHSGVYPETNTDTNRNVGQQLGLHSEPRLVARSTTYDSICTPANPNSYLNAPSIPNANYNTHLGSYTNNCTGTYPETSNGTYAETLTGPYPATENYNCVNSDTQGEQDILEGVQGKVFLSPMTGMMQFLSVQVSSIVGGKRLEQKGPGSFKCYMWSIGDTSKYFGDVWYHWNTEYSVARQIFGNNVESRAVQEGIRLQRSALYKSNNMRGMGCRNVVARNGADLLRLLNYGQSQGHIFYYTYVIMHSTWCFSRTGKDIMKDISSKHAMHSDCSEKVRYAGEFVIVPNSRGDYRLVIDNSSGTYAPAADGLPYAVNMLKNVFAGLEVEGLDRTSSQFKAIHEWVTAHNHQLGLTTHKAAL